MPWQMSCSTEYLWMPSSILVSVTLYLGKKRSQISASAPSIIFRKDLTKSLLKISLFSGKLWKKRPPAITCVSGTCRNAYKILERSRIIKSNLFSRKFSLKESPTFSEIIQNLHLVSFYRQHNKKWTSLPFPYYKQQFYSIWLTV